MTRNVAPFESTLPPLPLVGKTATCNLCRFVAVCPLAIVVLWLSYLLLMNFILAILLSSTTYTQIYILVGESSGKYIFLYVCLSVFNCYLRLKLKAFSDFFRMIVWVDFSSSPTTTGHYSVSSRDPLRKCYFQLPSLLLEASSFLHSCLLLLKYIWFFLSISRP